MEAKVGFHSQISFSHTLSLNRLRVMSEIKEVQIKMEAEQDFSRASISSNEVRHAALVIAHAILNPCMSNILSSFLSKV